MSFGHWALQTINKNLFLLLDIVREKGGLEDGVVGSSRVNSVEAENNVLENFKRKNLYNLRYDDW